MIAALLGIADAWIVAAGGVISAAVAGGAAVTGVLINAHTQAKPNHVEVDDSEIGMLRASLVETKLDRDYWRDLALEWMPRRRREDPQPDDTEGRHLPD